MKKAERDKQFLKSKKKPKRGKRKSATNQKDTFRSFEQGKGKIEKPNQNTHPFIKSKIFFKK